MSKFAFFVLILLLSTPHLLQAQSPEHPSVSGEQGAADSPEIHPEVAWSLSYELPDSDCKKPKLRRSNEVAGHMDRYERLLTRYVKCVQTYQSDLIEDHQRIFAAAKHGLSQQQALRMVDHLKAIEGRLESISENVVIERDGSEFERVFAIGNRSSI